MARPKSEFLSSLGTMFQIWKSFTDEVLAKGGTDDDLRQIQTDIGLRRALAELVVKGKKQKSITRPTYQVSVDYRLTLPTMILAGHYDWTNSDITAEHFPIKGEGEQSVEITLFYPNQITTSDQVMAEMDQAGYRPAKLEELLALGATSPDLQREFPIIALGSVWVRRDGDRGVASLDRDGSGRELYLDWFGSEWDEHCRFAAVRK